MQIYDERFTINIIGRIVQSWERMLIVCHLDRSREILHTINSSSPRKRFLHFGRNDSSNKLQPSNGFKPAQSGRQSSSAIHLAYPYL